MAFDIFDLGPIGAKLQEYADRDGRIPEAGDDWQDFNWPRSLAERFGDRQTGQERWQAFLELARTETSIAIQALLELETDY